MEPNEQGQFGSICTLSCMEQSLVSIIGREGPLYCNKYSLFLSPCTLTVEVVTMQISVGNSLLADDAG